MACKLTHRNHDKESFQISREHREITYVNSKIFDRKTGKTGGIYTNKP